MPTISSYWVDRGIMCTATGVSRGPFVSAGISLFTDIILCFSALFSFYG